VVRDGSIGTPADATGALATGAINVLTDVLEPFSSSGPTDDGRLKPEICGPDNVSSHQSSLNPFAGTSASAPHTAGGAALLLNQTPGLSADELQNVLINSARFNPTYSINNLCGSDSGALKLQTPPITETDSLDVSENSLMNTKAIVTDTPILDDISILGREPTLLKDVPTFGESTLLLSSLSSVDIPNVVDEGILNADISLGDAPLVSDNSFLTHVPIEVSDIPNVIDKSIINSDISEIDVPEVIDSALRIKSSIESFNDIPTFGDVVILLSSLSIIDLLDVFDKAILSHLPVERSDVPTVVDKNKMNADILDDDIPIFGDVVILLSSLSSVDTPNVVDEGILNADILVGDAPSMSDKNLMTRDAFGGDIPTFGDAVILLSSLSSIDLPEVLDKVILSHLPIERSDVPSVVDSSDLRSDISVKDEPKVGDGVKINTGILTSDSPIILESERNIKSGVERISEAPLVNDKVILSHQPISEFDTPTFGDSIILLSSLSYVDAPDVTDSVSMNVKISGIDIPEIDDSKRSMGMPSLGDSPNVEDRTFLSHLPILLKDTPTFADAVITLSSLSVTDVPSVVDDVEGMGMPSSSDAPEVDESVSMNTVGRQGDAPQVVDSVVVNSEVLVSDVPSVVDEVEGLELIFADEIPAVDDIVSMSTVSRQGDAPQVVDSVIVNSVILSTEVPRVSDGAFKDLEPNEQGITNNQEEATATVLQPELVITSSDAVLSTVNVPLEVTNAILDYEEILTIDADNNKMVNTVNPLTINAQTSIGSVNVEFPADLTISSSDEWTGEVHLPQVKDPASVTPPNGESVDSVIELGFDDIEITFDKPVRIVLEGQAGKTAFYERSGVTTVINSVCTSDSFDDVNSLLSAAGIKECKINSDGDLVIWTLHFTLFGSSSSTPSSSSTSSPGTTSSGGSFSSGGGGGGSKFVILSGGIAGSGGIILDAVHLYEVSWNKCDENIMRIVVGPSEKEMSVQLRTHSAGLVQVTLADDQPYDDKLVYESRIDLEVTFVQVQVESLSTSSPSIVQKSIDLKECVGKEIVFSEPEKATLPVFEQFTLISSILENVSPRNQIAIGVEPESVICKEGLELVFKASNGMPACVTQETSEKLVQRGWGVIFVQ